MKSIKNIKLMPLVMWICGAIFLAIGFPDPILITLGLACGFIGYVFNKRTPAKTNSGRDIQEATSLDADGQNGESPQNARKAPYYVKSKPANLFVKKWYEAAKREFIAISLETTGLSSLNDRIIEISAIKYTDGIESDKFISFVNPKKSIPQRITEMNGITNAMVKDAPVIEDVLPDFLKFLGDSLIVAHSANLDIEFIEINANHLGLTHSWHYIDTASVAKKMFPGLTNYKQSTILNIIGHRQTTHNGSEDDCRGCAEIIKFTLDNLEYPDA